MAKQPDFYQFLELSKVCKKKKKEKKELHHRRKKMQLLYSYVYLNPGLYSSN